MKTKERLAYMALGGFLVMATLTMSGCMTMLYLVDDRALLEKHNAIELGMSETRVKWIMRGTPDKIIRPVGEDTTIWCYEDGTLFERWKHQSRFYFKKGVVIKKKRITNH